MLVLSRKTEQEILVNGNIKISVLKIKGNVVRIGIEAPAEVSIKRGELVTQCSEPTAVAQVNVDDCTVAYERVAPGSEVAEAVAVTRIKPINATART